jgi:hypothetical protein
VVLVLSLTKRNIITENFNYPGFVEVFSNDRTRCIATRDVANTFLTELTNDERAEIADGFIIDSGLRNRVFSLTDDRSVPLNYVGHVLGQGDNKFICVRITELVVYA